MEKTIGQQRVRVDFNPSEKGDVYHVKIKTAELITLLRDLTTLDMSGEQVRLFRKAQDEYESAAMWAVKALTFKE